MASLDTPSFCAIQFNNAGSYVRIPMLAGSSVSHDPAVSKLFLASNASFEAINFVRGLCQPAIDIVTVPMNTWFTVANLRRAFSVRSATTGLLSATNGKVAYQFGSGVGGESITYSFTKSYFGGMTLSSGGAGGPLSCRLSLLPCGDTQAVPAWPGNYDATVYGPSSLYMAEGVGANGIQGQLNEVALQNLTEVLGWTLSISNGLSPDVSLPVTAPAAGAMIYPSGYLNGPLMATLTLIQRLGATAYDSTDLTNYYRFQITVSDAAGANPVVFTFRGIKPPVGATVSMGVTTVARTYVGIGTSAGSGISLSID